MSYILNNVPLKMELVKTYTGTTEDEFIYVDFSNEGIIFDAFEDDTDKSGFTYYVPNATGSNRKIAFKTWNGESAVHVLYLHFQESTLDGIGYPSEEEETGAWSVDGGESDGEYFEMMDITTGNWATLSRQFNP
jgi:hypothetical protein